MEERPHTRSWTFFAFGAALAALVWGAIGLFEFALISRSYSLPAKKYLAFASEISFCYSSAGILMFLVLAAALFGLAALSRRLREKFARFRYPLAAALVLAQEMYFLKLENLLPWTRAELTWKLAVRNAQWLAYVLLVAAAIMVLAWLFRKRRAQLRTPRLLKLLFFAAAALFSGNIIFYLSFSPFRWIDDTAQTAPAPKDAPNLLIISIDALRPDHLPVYGYPSGRTPNLDQLAGQALVFSNAFSQSTWTFPAVVAMLNSKQPDAVYDCQPYLTGLEPDYKERVKQPMPADLLEYVLKSLPQEQISLPAVMAAHGYRTGAVVSNWFISSMLGQSRGFSRFVTADEPVSKLGPVKRVLLYRMPFPDLFSVAGRIYVSLMHGSYKLNPASSVYLNRYVEEILVNNRGEKFFLWIHYIEPHNGYGDDWCPTPPPLPGYQGKLKPGFDKIYDVASGDLTLSPEDVSFLKYLYDSDISCLDAQLGKVFSLLKQNNLWDNTVIMLTADHGEQFFEHGHLAHRFDLYDEDIRVPLLIKPAGPPRPGKIDLPVQLIDLAPTALELVGIPVPPEFRGRSLKPAIQGQTMDGDSLVYSSCNLLGEPSFAIRENGFLLIHRSLSGRTELYDMKNDPQSRTDLSGRMPELKDRMLAELQQIMARNREVRGKSATQSAPLRLTPEQMEKLRALGYAK